MTKTYPQGYQPEQSLNFKGISFSDVLVPHSSLSLYHEKIINEDLWIQRKNEKITKVTPSDFLLEYNNQGDRDRMLQELALQKGKHTEEYQVPICLGKAEYQGKYYILINILRKETDLNNEYVYNGILVGRKLNTSDEIANVLQSSDK